MATKKTSPPPEPQKKRPARMGRPPVAVKAPPPGPPKPESMADQVRRQYLHILGMYALGYTMHEAGQACAPVLSGDSIRVVLAADHELRERYELAKEMRAHHFVDISGRSGVTLTETGFHKEGGELLLKVAAKIAPKLYGDKSTVALTGADGGAVQSVVELSPSDAYKRMLSGA